MPTPLDKVRTLEERRADLKTQLVQVGDLRPGSLVERYRRCGKAGCHCAGKDAEGHGPSWSLTHEVGGKTVTRVIPPEAVTLTREQITEYRRFRGLVRDLVEASELLCNAKLEAEGATADAAAEKRGSKRPSRQRSSPRSKRS